MKERQEAIKRFIEANGEVSIGRLTDEFSGWSEMTIRRDLAALEKSRAVILTRGGARPFPGRYGLSEAIYSERANRNFEAKQQIAEKALKLIEPGKGIFIDSGTTAMALARRLPDYHLVVVCAAPNIAMELATRTVAPSVVLLGGAISRRSLAVADPDVARQLDRLNIDTAFIAASGFDEKAGFSVGSQLDAMLKRTVIEKARRVVAIMDSSKAGAMMPFTFADPNEVDILVTDDEFPAELREHLAGELEIL